MTQLRERIDRIYEREACHIRPFIGSAFTAPRPDDLRVMAIGINAYVSGPNCEDTPAEAFERWFSEGRYRFQRAVLKDVTQLANAVTRPGSYLGGRTYRSRDSTIHTNAVKAYMPAARGKRAAQLTSADFERHLDQWYEELDAMAELGVLPHVVIVFGRPFWEAAWPTFEAPDARRHGHMKVLSYETRIRDHVSITEVETAAGR